MPTARQRATQRLAHTIARHRYPSHQLLDRLEGGLRTPEDLDIYAQMLVAMTEDQRYPSLRVLDRLDRAALAHELVTATHQDDDREEDA